MAATQAVLRRSPEHTCTLAEGLDFVHMATCVHYFPERLALLVASPTLDVHPRRHVAWSALLVQPHKALRDYLQSVISYESHCCLPGLQRGVLQMTQRTSAGQVQRPDTETCMRL